jgi:hypothetical protein
MAGLMAPLAVLPVVRLGKDNLTFGQLRLCPYGDHARLIAAKQWQADFHLPCENIYLRRAPNGGPANTQSPKCP